MMHVPGDGLTQALACLQLPEGITVRLWRESDFPTIQQLSHQEGWPTPTERPAEALAAWHRSSPALVAESDGAIIGFVRGVTDGNVATYIAEVLVASPHRGWGIGTLLLHAAQQQYPGTRLDLLATETSRSYYAATAFRPFFGFRRSWAEHESLREGHTR